MTSIEVSRYRLEGPVNVDVAGKEVYVHSLVGRGMVDGFQLGGRTSIFQAPGAGHYFAGVKRIQLKPLGPFDVLVVTAPCEVAREEEMTIFPEHHGIGIGNYYRDVYEILGGDSPARSIRFGETRNVKGGWSSWPPHSFDHKPELASQFEEVFVPFMRPRGGLALLRRQGIFHDGFAVDDAVTLVSGETVRVPLGSHPIVAGPEVELMYCWAYLSPIPKVYSKWAEETGGYA